VYIKHARLRAYRKAAGGAVSAIRHAHPASRQSRNRQQGHAHMSEDRPAHRTTTDSGVPIPSDEHSLTVGPDGPTVLQDHYLVQKLQHFNRRVRELGDVLERSAGRRG
jgi:hypothetical protein